MKGKIHIISALKNTHCFPKQQQQKNMLIPPPPPPTPALLGNSNESKK